MAMNEEVDIVRLRRRLVKRLYAVRHGYRVYISKQNSFPKPTVQTSKIKAPNRRHTLMSKI